MTYTYRKCFEGKSTIQAAIEIAKRMKDRIESKREEWWHKDTVSLVNAALALEVSAEESHTSPESVCDYEYCEGGDKCGVKHRNPQPSPVVPKAGEWVKCHGKVFRAKYIANHFVYHHIWAYPFHELQLPTPDEIALAERREKLPPIPEGFGWVQDRSEKPHPKAMVNAGGGIWMSRGFCTGDPYRDTREYIKPIEPANPSLPKPQPITHWTITTDQTGERG